VLIGADRAFVQSEYFFRDLRLSLSQSVQFGRNAWIHPFVGGGVDIDYLRTTEDRAQQFTTIFATSPSSRDTRSVPVPELHERETTMRAVPFAKGGFKFYVSDRAFVVQEFKLGFTNHVDHLLWKTGVGIDF
jgi:hypothetical protein